MAAVRDDRDQLMARVWAVQAEVEQARREAEQARAEAVALAGQFEAIFAAVADGLVVYDGHGRILHSNVALRNLLALGRQPEFVSRPLCERARLDRKSVV